MHGSNEGPSSNDGLIRRSTNSSTRGRSSAGGSSQERQSSEGSRRSIRQRTGNNNFLNRMQGNFDDDDDDDDGDDDDDDETSSSSDNDDDDDDDDYLDSDDTDEEESEAEGDSDVDLDANDNDVDDAYMLQLHDAVVFNSFHCPPFPSIDDTTSDDFPCDCVERGLPICGRTDNFNYFVDPPFGFQNLNFETEEAEANETMNEEHRSLNNEQRKSLYRRVFFLMDFPEEADNKRRQLPNCVCAKIRQIYPSATGMYMGYKEA